MRRLLFTALVALAFIIAALVPTMTWANTSYSHASYSRGAGNGAGPSKWFKHRKHHKKKYHNIYKH